MAAIGEEDDGFTIDSDLQPLLDVDEEALIEREEITGRFVWNIMFALVVHPVLQSLIAANFICNSFET